MTTEIIEITADTPREVRALNGWADVDRALLALRIAEAELATVGAKHDAVIQIAQEAKQSELAPIISRQERMRQRVEAFVGEHREGLDGKSLKLTHGTVGYRMGNPTVEYEHGEEHTMKMLHTRGLGVCVVQVEKIDKKALRGLSDLELAVIGAKVLQEEAFFLKLAKSPAVLYPDQVQVQEGQDA